jgi:secreted trypsin-like serine protease
MAMKIVFECSQDVVLNGNTAGVNEFPLMASLVNEQTAKLFCGAVIIGKHHVLTAAHCMTDVNPFQIILLVGDHDFINHGKCILSHCSLV